MNALQVKIKNVVFNCCYAILFRTQAHSSVERAGLIGCIKMRSLPTDENSSLRGHTLRDAIDKDKAQGLIPIFVRIYIVCDL